MPGKPRAGRRRIQAVPARISALDTAHADVGQPAPHGPVADTAEPRRSQPSKPPKPPKVRIRGAAEGRLSVEVVTSGASPAATFGTADPDAINALLGQLVSVVCPGNTAKPPDEHAINSVLALLHGIGPTDAVEGMLATQLVVAQHGAMDVMRRAMHPDQTPEGRRLYLGLATRLMATFALQVETLNRGRGRGPVQRMVVERVNVGPGGQAVVGVVPGKGAGG
jgi:hypothetical protein